MSRGATPGDQQRPGPLRIVGWCATAVLGSCCVLLIALSASGRLALLSVPTASMEPTIPLGAAIAATPVPVDAVAVGDVVVFEAPGSDHLTVHRVVQVDGAAGDRRFRTKGDANASPDAWHLELRSDSVHRVGHVVPHLGRVLSTLHGRSVRLSLLVVGAVLFVLGALRRIWVLPASAAVRRHRSARARRRARVIAAAAAVAAVAATGGEAQAQLSTATGSVLPVASASLGTPTGLGCAWDTATTLTFGWEPTAGGAPEGLRLDTSDAVDGTYTTAATVTPATTATTTITPAGPVTTERYYRVGTFRGTWSGVPTGPIGSAQCRGAIGVFAGSGTAGYLGDGGPATSARLNAPRGVAVAPSGDVYIADTSNNRVRRVGTDGTISTFAGGGASTACAYSGAVSGLRLTGPYDVAVDLAGDVYIADTGANCVRRVDGDGNVTRVAGGGSTSTCNSTGAASAVSLNRPRGVAVDAAGTVYIADASRNCVRKVVGTTYSHVAGGGGTTTCDSTGAATDVSLSAPNDVQVAGDGTVYIVDRGRSCVRKVVGATYAHVLGGGSTTSCTSSGPATSVALSTPEAVAIDGAGRVLVAEAGRRCVRAVTDTTYSHVALTGANSSVGDDGPALAATMRAPSGLAVTADGDLLVADRSTSSGGSEVRSIQGPWPP